MNIVIRLLVDADAFVAINDGKDPNHQRVREFSALITAKDIELLTSDPAFGEAITVISQNAGLKKAITFAEEILRSQIEIVEVDSALRRKALDIFKKQTSKNSRFTDSVNMAIMNEKGIDTIFSFDMQYKKNGFQRFGIDTA